MINKIILYIIIILFFPAVLGCSENRQANNPVIWASVKVDVSGMKEGDYSGLIALQRRYGFVGVKVEGDNKSVIMVGVTPDKPGQSGQPSKPGFPVEIKSIPLSQPKVYFKIDCDFRNRTDKAFFYYSLDGKTWNRIGDLLQMEYTLPHFMGYRFGLFNYATKRAGGFVDFDYYHISDEISVQNIE